jgi:phage/plasmid-associated DNA primase
MSANNLGEYIQNNIYVKDSGNKITHTKIGSKEHNIFGASYTINNNDEFLNHYFKQLKLGGNFYFTEKQLDSDDRMLVVDLDFRYDSTIKTRQHNEETIKDIINLYAEKINEIYNFESNSKVTAFVMEKPNVNIVTFYWAGDDDCVNPNYYTKDGIHIIFTLKMKTEEQMLLRKKMIMDINFDLPLTTKCQEKQKLDDVFDEGITKGCINWQLYGSKKPNNEAYKLTYTYDIIFNTDMEDYEVKTNTTFDIEKDYKLLSVRYKNHPKFELNNSEFLLEALKSEKEELQPKTKKVIAETPKDQTTINNNEKIVNLIKSETLGIFEDWKKIIFAMKNEGFTEEFAKQTSNRATGNFTPLTEEAWEKIWNAETSQLTMGTLRFYAKRDNPEEYSLTCIKSHEEYYEYDEKTLCDYFFEYHKDDVICCNNKIYVFYNDFWIEDKKGKIIQKLLINSIRKLYMELDKKLNDKIKVCYEQDKVADVFVEQKALVATLNKNYGFQRNKNVWGLVENTLCSMNLKNDIFDKNPDLFVFNNTCFDLQKKEWRKLTQFDYVLFTCKNDYIKPTPTQIATIKKIVEDIFPDKEMRKSYMSILKNGLSGHRIEKFIIATGDGRNGKGLINDYMKYLLGDYYEILSLNLLTKPLKEGANTELRCLHNKRFIKASEPESSANEKLKINNIKSLTGESSMKARGLYEDNFNINICAISVLEANGQPPISLDGNTAEKERFVTIAFDTTFLKDDTEENKYKLIHEPEKYKKVNEIYKSEAFIKEHICAFFHYIIDYPTDTKLYEVYNTIRGQKQTLEWFMDKDEFLNWFQEEYEKDENGFISIKDLYKIYKNSSLFYSLSKAQQRQNNEKYFRQMVIKKMYMHYVPPKGSITIQTKDGTEKIQTNKDGIIGFTQGF